MEEALLVSSIESWYIGSQWRNCLLVRLEGWEVGGGGTASLASHPLIKFKH